MPKNRSTLPGVSICLLLLSTALLVSADEPPLSRDELLARCADPSRDDYIETRDQLEKAVKRDPHDVALSAAMIHMLDAHKPEGSYVAIAFSSKALAANPHNPVLLAARARAVPPDQTRAVLADLAKLPGHETEAAHFNEMLDLGLPIPWDCDWQNPATYLNWADRLIAAKKFDRATAVVNEGIEKLGVRGTQARRELGYRRVILLALAGQFDAAESLQKDLGFPQVPIADRYEGPADVFLLMGQPTRALESFGTCVPDIKPPARGVLHGVDPRIARRIMAAALADTGKVDQAVNLLSRDADDNDRLILLSILVSDRRFVAAVRLADQIVAALPPPGSVHLGSSLSVGFPADKTPSLARRYDSALEILNTFCQDYRKQLAETFGFPNSGRVELKRTQFGLIPTAQMHQWLTGESELPATQLLGFPPDPDYIGLSRPEPIGWR